MFRRFNQWRQQRVLKKSPISRSDWLTAASQISVLDRLTEDQQQKLFDLSTLFLHYKNLSGAQGFVITDSVRRLIALQACLPILQLGLDWYRGWSSVIVYPSAFKRESTVVDQFGVAHQEQNHLSGEAWLRGPVILSWTDTHHAGIRDGHNVVIHEFVHKLNMLNGRANGFPPLQPGMNPSDWTDFMSKAFEDFQSSPKKGLDRYGATNPAEFFAVLSEVFFETPQALVDAYPELYTLMTQFFMQKPLNN